MDARRTRPAQFFGLFGSLALVVLASAPAGAQPVCLEFDTELTSLNLTGGPFPMPLASDPSNALGDSVDGYGFVDSLVTITLSSQRPVDPGPQSLGVATAFEGQPAKATIDAMKGVGEFDCTTEVDPVEHDGEQWAVDSFFDVFFDITVTDVDARDGRDYAGQLDGASFVLQDNGPAHMISEFYQVLFDAAAPNFGLVPPPEADPYIGHFDIEIPLGIDINGNEFACPDPAPGACLDKIKFTLASHSAGDANRNFIVLPNGDVIEEFDSAAFLEGAVVDAWMDPPFFIGARLPNGLPDPAAFGGPTTAQSTLNTPITGAAVPSVGVAGIALLVMLMLGLVTAVWLLRRRNAT